MSKRKKKTEELNLTKEETTKAQKRKKKAKRQKLTKEERAIKRKERKAKTKENAFKFWTWGKYFLMKWRFRLDQARAIFGLATFAALLAVNYIDNITWFDKQNFWRGEFLLTVIVLVVFMIGGYIYDRFFKLWSETQTVTVDRNPYTYVPHPRERMITLAFWTYVLQSFDLIAEKLDVDIPSKEIMRPLIDYYISLTPNITDFEQKGLKMRTATSKIISNYLEIADHGELEAIVEYLTEELKKKKKEQKT